MSAQDVSVNRLFVNMDMSARDVSVNNLYINADLYGQDASFNILYVNQDICGTNIIGTDLIKNGAITSDKLALDAAIQTKVAKDAVGTEELQDDISMTTLLLNKTYQ